MYFFIFVQFLLEYINYQVHSPCVDLRPGDRSFFAKGPPPSSFCLAQFEAHGPPSAMAVRKIVEYLH